MSYIDRLKPCKYISPSGIEFELLYDDLARTGGKKASVNEILDSNDSVAQDQGNIATKFPVTFYIAGENYDEEADNFYDALSERYTLESPGIFSNPRWGSIQVFPLSWDQKEKFVEGSGKAVFSVEFVQIFPSSVFQRELRATSNIVNKQKDLLILTQLEELSLQFASVRASVSNTLSNTLGKVLDVTRSLLTLQTDLLDTISSIYNSTFSLLDDIANNSILILGNIQLLSQIPIKLTDNTLNKIDSYNDLINSLMEYFRSKSDIIPEAKKNNVIIAQNLIGFVCVAQSISAIYTEYPTRESAINAITKIGNTYESFLDLLDSLKTTGESDIAFSGSHEFLTIVEDIQKSVLYYLLKKSFSLSSLRKITLTNDSNAIELCYKYYKDISKETIEKFVTVNNIKYNEFILIPSGRELIFYD